MICGTENDAYKPSIKSDRLNLTLNKLCSEITGAGETVYCYVIDTITHQDKCFLQTGCGPNFKGDLITLCTCKHYMRCFKKPEDWEGKWIVGVTNVQAGEGKNWLVYLMQVGKAFESHYELWKYLKNDKKETLREKSASNSIFGDVYIPTNQKMKLYGEDRFRPGNYAGPCDDHCHGKSNKKKGCGLEWHKDIKKHSSKRLKNHTPALLVGDPDCSFLWNKRLIHLNVQKVMTQGQKKYRTADDFLGTLKKA